MLPNVVSTESEYHNLEEFNHQTCLLCQSRNCTIHYQDKCSVAFIDSKFFTNQMPILHYTVFANKGRYFEGHGVFC